MESVRGMRGVSWTIEEQNVIGDVKREPLTDEEP